MASRPVAVQAQEGGPIDDLLAALLDLTSVQILAAASGRVLTVRELAAELDLPLASLYRRVRTLQAANALSCARTRDDASGKDVLAYTSTLAAIHIDFARARPTVEITYARE